MGKISSGTDAQHARPFEEASKSAKNIERKNRISLDWLRFSHFKVTKYSIPLDSYCKYLGKFRNNIFRSQLLEVERIDASPVRILMSESIRLV